MERTGRFWEMCGASDCFGGLAEDASEHQYTLVLARRAANFLAKHLLGTEMTALREVSVFAPSLLWCTESGQVRGEIAGARAVHDENRFRTDELEHLRNNLPDEQRAESAKQ